MKITKRDLDDIFNLTHQEFINGAMGHFTEKQFRTKCYIIALCAVLKIEQPEFEPQPLEKVPAGEY